MRSSGCPNVTRREPDFSNSPAQYPSMKMKLLCPFCLQTSLTSEQLHSPLVKSKTPVKQSSLTYWTRSKKYTISHPLTIRIGQCMDSRLVVEMANKKGNGRRGGEREKPGQDKDIEEKPRQRLAVIISPVGCLGPPLQRWSQYCPKRREPTLSC